MREICNKQDFETFLINIMIGEQAVKKKVISIVAVLILISSMLTACVEGILDNPVPSPNLNVVVRPEEIDIDGHSGFALFLDERYVIQEIDPRWFGPGHFRASYGDRLVMTVDQFLDVTAQEFVEDIVISWSESGIDITYEPPTADFSFFSIPRFSDRLDGEGLERQYFTRDNGQGGIFHITILLSPDEWEEHGSRLLQSLASFEVLVD